jgi:hypothetical protein
MLYKKMSVELIVVADEADAVAAELNAALDRLRLAIETKHPGTQRNRRSRIRWPHVRRLEARSGLHVGA